MNRLQQIAQQQPEMVLDRLVEVANDLLPQFLPDPNSGSRGQEPVNPRLVRHYTTQGWLDKPLKQGREARYTYRHLLQLLVLRRLLAEGYSASSIGSLIGGQANSALQDILQGGVQLKVEAANPALAFLSQIRDRGASSRPHPSQPPRSAVPVPPVASTPAQVPLPVAPSICTPQVWTHIEILDGLELQVHRDFVVPTTAHERDNLLQLIADRLTQLSSHPRPTP